MRFNFRQSSSRLFVALVFFALAALALSGCGRMRAFAHSGQHSVTLSWAASTSPVVGYNVYRAIPPNGSFTKLNSKPIITTHYTDTTVEAGHTYTYRVTAVDEKKMESPTST